MTAGCNQPHRIIEPDDLRKVNPLAMQQDLKET